jgi:CRP-like cAMP-binding protein
MGNLSQLKQWLRQFGRLTEEDCQLFEPDLIVRQLDGKELFLSEGQTCREMGFVNHGSVRMYYLSDDKEINTHFFFENEFVVDFDSFIQEKPSRYYLQAMEKTELVSFHLQTLQNAYDRSQNWERFGREMAEYSFKLTTRRVESFLFMNGEQRYLHLLETHPEVFERVPLYHIASYLGLERESLSRLRKKIVTDQRL